MSLGLKRNSTKNKDGTITCAVSAKIDQYLRREHFHVLTIKLTLLLTR